LNRAFEGHRESLLSIVEPWSDRLLQRSAGVAAG
jgi:hypothetical protein